MSFWIMFYSLNIVLITCNFWWGNLTVSCITGVVAWATLFNAVDETICRYRKGQKLLGHIPK